MGAKGAPKGTQREPKVTPEEPKKPKVGPKGPQRTAKGTPKDGQREPKGTPKGAKGSQREPNYINSRSTAQAAVMMLSYIVLYCPILSYIVTLS